MKKILIVDDSDAVRGQVKAALEGAGFQVVEAVDGLDGLAKANENKDVNLIISDVNMPRMDGLTMCGRVREIAELKQTPIFMLTTETDAGMKDKGKAFGVRAWMVKPFNAEKMVMGVKKILEG
ncbi:MAG: response regulator [Bdellovibrionaceae bacterium]|nr:response regulator [Pseudobdellovibrionaceae bacterium]